jgi:hypothetical protein
MRRLFIFLLLWFLPALHYSQNRVLNPDFEQKTGCPSRSGQINLAVYWFSANNGTPDYFNDCSPGIEFGTEFNKKGGQIPHSGHAYAGLQFYNLNGNEYYEYLENQLDSSLAPGQLYCISAFVSLGDVLYAYQKIGAVLSMNSIQTGTPLKIILPALQLTGSNYLTDQSQWMCIKGLYRAKGGEKFLTLGDFSKTDSFWYIPSRSATDSVFKSTYYFVDDVSVMAIADSSDCHCLPGSR